MATTTDVGEENVKTKTSKKMRMESCRSSKPSNEGQSAVTRKRADSRTPIPESDYQSDYLERNETKPNYDRAKANSKCMRNQAWIQMDLKVAWSTVASPFTHASRFTNTTLLLFY